MVKSIYLCGMLALSLSVILEKLFNLCMPQLSCLEMQWYLSSSVMVQIRICEAHRIMSAQNMPPGTMVLSESSASAFPLLL